jgi:hypothetical protein
LFAIDPDTLEIVWTGSPSGQYQGVTAKNAVDDWLGRMAVNKEMVCETPASASISGEKYRAGGPSPSLPFLLPLPLPLRLATNMLDPSLLG